MKLIFLDIDGVLNCHTAGPNGYCGIDKRSAWRLNNILHAAPDAQLVISSSWRYTVLNGDMTLKGFEHMLLTHGINCHGRVHGVTEADPETFRAEDHQPPFDVEYWRARGLQWRADQILKYAAEHGAECFVVLDDLPLEVPNLVRTDPSRGLAFGDEWAALNVLAPSKQRTNTPA